MPAHGWLLVWASDKNGVRGGGQLHTNFKLGASGEPVLLTAANGVTLLDQAPAMALTADRSYARQPDGGATWSIYPVATPGAANGAPTGTVPAPLFSSAGRLPRRVLQRCSMACTGPGRADPLHARRQRTDGDIAALHRARSPSTIARATRTCSR